MAASTITTIPPLSVWPCGTCFSNTQEGTDRRSAPITDPLFRWFGIPNRSPDPLVQRAGRDHPFEGQGEQERGFQGRGQGGGLGAGWEMGGLGGRRGGTGRVVPVLAIDRQWYQFVTRCMNIATSQ